MTPSTGEARAEILGDAEYRRSRDVDAAWAVYDAEIKRVIEDGIPQKAIPPKGEKERKNGNR